jgi:COMPASS component SWD3
MLDISESAAGDRSDRCVMLSFSWSAASQRITAKLLSRPQVKKSGGSSRVRAVAEARAARNAELPQNLGGLEISKLGPLPPSRPASAAPTPRVPTTPIPTLTTAWEASCEPLEEGEEADVFCVRYSPDEQLIAAGCGDGSVRIVRASNGAEACALHEPPSGPAAVSLPATCLRWRPTGRLLLSASASGCVQHWNVPSSPALVHTTVEMDVGGSGRRNQIYALDYSDGRFATAGKDAAVRVYDDSAPGGPALVSTLAAGMVGYPGAASGHTSRVFSLKFSTAEPFLLLSAGWDNTVQFWDLRAGETVASIMGPHICGDALDVSGDGHELLTASWRPNKPLQIWDMRTRELLSTLPYRQCVEEFGKSDPCKLYGAQFSRAASGGSSDPGLVAATGSGAADGTGDLRVFLRRSLTPLGKLTLPQGSYGLDIARGGRRLCVTGGGNRICAVDLPEPPPAVDLS